MDGALAVLEQAVGVCLSVPLWARAPGDVVGYLDRVQVVDQRLAALKLALIRQVDCLDVARHDGATNTVSWLRDRHRVSGGAASRSVKLARVLDADLPAVSGALAAGAVNTEQAHVITAAVDRVPGQVRQAAEQALVQEATIFGPKELGRLAERILDHVAPELARRRTENELAALEREAHDARRLFLVDVPGTCRVRVSGFLNREGAAHLRAALDPLSAPSTGGGEPDLRSPGQRRADALVEISRRVLATGKPRQRWRPPPGRHHDGL